MDHEEKDAVSDQTFRRVKYVVLFDDGQIESAFQSPLAEIKTERKFDMSSAQMALGRSSEQAYYLAYQSLKVSEPFDDWLSRVADIQVEVIESGPFWRTLEPGS